MTMERHSEPCIVLVNSKNDSPYISWIYFVSKCKQSLPATDMTASLINKKMKIPCVAKDLEFYVVT